MGNNIPGYWKRIFPDRPCSDYFVWGWGAHFIVSRERIQARPPAFYENLLQLTLEDARAGVAMEMMWPQILGFDPTTLQTGSGPLRHRISNPISAQKPE